MSFFRLTKQFTLLYLVGFLYCAKYSTVLATTTCSQQQYQLCKKIPRCWRDVSEFHMTYKRYMLLNRGYRKYHYKPWWDRCAPCAADRCFKGYSATAFLLIWYNEGLRGSQKTFPGRLTLIHTFRTSSTLPRAWGRICWLQFTLSIKLFTARFRQWLVLRLALGCPKTTLPKNHSKVFQILKSPGLHSPGVGRATRIVNADEISWTGMIATTQSCEFPKLKFKEHHENTYNIELSPEPSALDISYWKRGRQIGRNDTKAS